MNKSLMIIASILVCLIAGLIGMIFTSSAIPTWYAGLEKPSFNPPNWIFGPVWTTLYILMGISLYLVWSKGIEKKEVQQGMLFFGIQLFINALWSIIFFGLHQPLIAFIEIIIMWIMILITIIKFYNISKPAAYLLIPYILWVSFASVLNLFITMLN
jgi:tryptophan-rich sensory protein